MKNQVRCWQPFLCLILVSGWTVTSSAGDARVLVETRGETHRLLRNGEPYFIRGVGGNSRLAELAALGGNSIRTWDTKNLDKILDAAGRLQLTVCVGLWLGHERHGFDYQDEASVVRQLNECLEAVRKYKDHPAVLMWGIGNEMEGRGTNPAIWYAVNHIARECKRIDPDHPTMTIIAELGESKVESIERFCPDIDIVGINAYGGISTLAERYRATQGSKPYIVTEMGPLGPWEVGKTKWGSPIEETSTAKAIRYASGYEAAVTGAEGLCLGSYAFLWGNKQETTATWFGIVLPDGSRLAAADALSEAWTGTAPVNRCPEIRSLRVDGPSVLSPGETVLAKLSASDPEGDPLKVQWVFRRDSRKIGSGGDAQREEAELSHAVSGKGMEAVVTAPKKDGGYRLFAYLRDGKGGAAVANIPLYVDVPMDQEDASKAELPFTLYGDAAESSPYEPSGHMGNVKAIRVDPKCTVQPRSGETCLRIDYRAHDSWGGVLWQSPADDWKGEEPGGLNLSGATELEFWARGLEGGEVVNFVFGVLDGQQKYRDTAKGELKSVRLTKKWQRLSIPLKDLDLSRIKTGFGWSLAGQGKALTFFLDDIRYLAAR